MPFRTRRIRVKLKQYPDPDPESIATSESDASLPPSPVESLPSTATSSSSVDDTAGSRLLPSIRKTTLSAFGHLSKHELALLDRAVHQDDFIHLFVLGPSFRESHRQKLVFHLLSSHQTVLDGYLAFALSMGGDEVQVNNSYRHAASALVTLRSLSATATDPSQADSASSCLILGWQMLHFVFKIGGGELLEICNQTLSLIKPHFSSHGGFSGETTYLSFMTSLVLTETAECLFKTRLPTVRMDHPAATTRIDGCVGLCTSLLPYLHDLAVLNHAMGASRRSSKSLEAGNKKELLQQPRAEMNWAKPLAILERRVRSWQPNVPPDFCHGFTTIEAAHMMCQAQVMQTAALLIIHRLRYPYGTQDATARALSSSILDAMYLALNATGKVPFCLDLPLIVANFEVSDPSARVQNVSRFTSIGSYSSVFRTRIWTMLSLVWGAKHGQSDMHWYDLGDILSRFS
ncbi:hypothetical protein C2857_001574 [Epichloe festucae Fl1]|uniref:Uncharacterized protein n=1 Tax=Epichloe festucae (strain Fl1) TaxID=877507 RepID=A0A7S9KJR7_EPIFF|nr:hypothetical protein C2857_001574 [Epichloe festucae Fl1]